MNDRVTPTEAQRLSEQAIQRAEKALRTPDLEWAHDLVHGLAHDVLSLARQLAEAKRENERKTKALEWIERVMADPNAASIERSGALRVAHEALNTGDVQASPPKDSGESSTDGATTGVEGAA